MVLHGVSHQERTPHSSCRVSESPQSQALCVADVALVWSKQHPVLQLSAAAGDEQVLFLLRVKQQHIGVKGELSKWSLIGMDYTPGLQ